MITEAWISKLVHSEEATILEKRAQLHRAAIRAVMMPIFHGRLLARIRREIAQYAAVLPPERRLAFVGGFLAGNFMVRKQGSHPLVDLSVEPCGDIIIKFTYQYRRTDTSETKEWGDIIRCEIDSADMGTLSIGDRKFRDEIELARFLLQPLVDHDFTPPD